MRIARSVLAVGGVVVAAAAIGFTNPKTVHALAAALVQVTNTAANPVVTQGVGQQAAQQVHLWCPPYTTGGVCLPAPSPNGYDTQPYRVPAGQTLVITAVDITPVGNYFSGCNFTHQDNLVAQGIQGTGDAFWSIPNLATVHMVYPSGMIFPSDTSLSTNSGGYPSTVRPECSYNDRIDLYGYLTAA